jgi:ubiquinol-cytochrome c reductase cytochrome c1 subunit
MLQRISVPACILGVSLQAKLNSAKCSEDHVHAPTYDFKHYGMFSSFDAMSVRRGFQVYRQVCASCHSIDKIAFRQLVGVTHTEEQMKAIAASYDITDKAPNDLGEYFERPGKLSDNIPSPYKNEEQARSANAGALPPDLSLMVKARHTGANYIFALLTGYTEPPAGKVVPPGLHYNPYFPGGQIAMGKQLVDGQVEYEDGTPATEAQMAKDVACFLAWTAEPEHDERKMTGIAILGGIIVAALITGYHKRLRWSTIKTQKISYVAKK